MPCELMNPQRGHSVAVSLLFDTASVNIRAQNTDQTWVDGENPTARIANKKRK